MEGKPTQRSGGRILLLVVGVLLALVVAAVFIPIKDCGCAQFGFKHGSTYCPTCGGTGRLSLYEFWKYRGVVQYDVEWMRK